jgi:hypothetical protein
MERWMQWRGLNTGSMVVLMAVAQGTLVLQACAGDSSIALSGCLPGTTTSTTQFGPGPGLGAFAQVAQTGAGGSVAPTPVGVAGSQGLAGSIVVFPPQGLPQGVCAAPVSSIGSSGTTGLNSSVTTGVNGSSGVPGTTLP